MTKTIEQENKRAQINALREQIQVLAKQLYDLVEPTEAEKADVIDDLICNPHIYASYLEDDALFIAENVQDLRECDNEEVP